MSEMPPPPLPIEPLGYYRPVGPVRPGILVAVGVLSIIFGAFGTLTACSGVFTSLTFSRIRFPVAVPTSGPATVEDYSRSALDRMSSENRVTVINVLTRSTPLSPARRQLLDRLLSSAGDDIFPFSGANVDEARILTSLSDSGRVADPQGQGSNYFIVANGRIEISDTEAAFMPQQGPAVRVVMDEEADQPRINRSQARQRLNANMQFTTTAASFTAGTMSAPFVVYAVVSAANMLLAIYLVIIGIMVLTNSRRGRGLHLVYAYLKIPLVVIGSIAYAVMMQQWMAGMMAGGGAVPIMTMVNGLFACIYPVALLIVMNSRTIKRYYAMDV